MGCSNDRSGCYVYVHIDPLVVQRREPVHGLFKRPQWLLCICSYRSTGCVKEGTNTWVAQTTAMIVMYMFI